MAQKALGESAERNVSVYVQSHLGGTISHKKLDELCGTPSSNLQYDCIVGPLVEAKVLEPTTSVLTKGSKKRPIYREYRIAHTLPPNLTKRVAFLRTLSRGQDLSGYLANLSTEVTGNGYLAQHLTQAKEWNKELREVSAWLDSHADPVAHVLCEERSYEIFRNEKLLSPRADARAGVRLNSLLHSIDVWDRLCVIEVPPTLQYYLPLTLRKNLCMLIVENHVPFVRLQEELKHGRRRFFGRHVDGVIYGAGSAVSKEGVLAETERMFGRGGPVRYLYWGDIDRPGILAYEQLCENADVELLLGAYEAMLDASMEGELPVAGGATRVLHNGIDLACRLNRERLEVYLRVLADDLRIPQEAVPSQCYCNGGLAERRLRPSRRARLR